MPTVALTFDDGPHPTTTDAILNILTAEKVRATFFVVGEMCELHQAPLRRVINAGMPIGLHGWAHADFAKHDVNFMHEDLQRALDVLAGFGVRPATFRPPYGHWDDRLLSVANSLGLLLITWSVDSLDWTKPGPDVIVDNVLGEAEDRSIILLHDGGGDRTQTVAALPRVIAGLRESGFTFGSLPQT